MSRLTRLVVMLSQGLNLSIFGHSESRRVDRTSRRVEDLLSIWLAVVVDSLALTNLLVSVYHARDINALITSAPETVEAGEVSSLWLLVMS